MVPSEVSWLSKVWAQCIPDIGMPSRWVEATLLPALVRPVNGGLWMASEELQGWVHFEVNRKCDSLLVQTNATRDHRQISLPHSLSATDDVTGVRPPATLLSSTLLCFSSASFADSLVQPRLEQASCHKGL
ncbi:unnamed protein product [Pleuronectes platessa]|uniref:Uncharacterized protein n=1 Tax=Pleuronectes platessa TaxID=8262 RepID=A0A9N7TGT2_PLEPL|nr:unnamed protein product [Pleuronectes platessa]